MSNENYNSSLNWKRKLDELESLPGETMPDKNVSWEKIHARVDGKKPERKPVWYWIAAASVLFLLMIPFFISYKKNDPLSSLSNTSLKQNESETKQNQQEKQVPVKTGNHNKDSFTVENDVLPEKNQPVSFHQSNKAGLKNVEENKKDESQLYDTINTQNQITETTDNSSPIIMDTSSSNASIIAAKKKLPVVHINELGEPDNEPQVARSSEKPSVHFLKLGSEEVYNSSASITKNFATINFKSSPN